jgi:sporulation protein YlmC with PRC-barrel domain
MPSALEVREWHTRKVVANDGHELGKLEDVYVNKDSGEPEFLLVESGFLGTSLHLVPAAGAVLEGDDVRVPQDKATVDAAPKVKADDDISVEEEQRLYDHYGMDYTPSGAGVITITRWVLITRS